MHFIAWVLIGLFAGFVASRMDERRGFAIVIDTALGIAGAIVAGLFFRRMRMLGVTGFDLWSLLAAVGGATLVLTARSALNRPAQASLR
jgi:uncharacterized membrane protein YeaQ/YmgE (transglycosylase-associated protein family)